MIYLITLLLSIIYFLNGCGNRYECDCECNGVINNDSTNTTEPVPTEIDKTICDPDANPDDVEYFPQFCKICPDDPNKYCIICPKPGDPDYEPECVDSGAGGLCPASLSFGGKTYKTAACPTSKLTGACCNKIDPVTKKPVPCSTTDTVLKAGYSCCALNAAKKPIYPCCQFKDGCKKAYNAVSPI